MNNTQNNMHRHYECVDARFLFFNGYNRFTVEFAYALSTWYIFKDEARTGAVHSKKIMPRKSLTPNRDEAHEVLMEYTEQFM